MLEEFRQFLHKDKRYDTLDDIDEFLVAYKSHRIEQRKQCLECAKKALTPRTLRRVQNDTDLEVSLVEQYLKGLLMDAKRADRLNDAIYYLTVEIAGRIGDSDYIYPGEPVELLQSRFDYGVHDYKPRASAVARGEIKNIRNEMLQRVIYNVNKALEGEVPDKVLDMIAAKIEPKISKIEKKMAAKISDDAVPDNLQALMREEVEEVCKKIYMQVLGVSPAEARELTKNEVEINPEFEKIVGKYSLGYRKFY